MNAPGSIFVRRQNYSPFAKLPKHKINSYHIKMEDDGSHGNDEVRWFILSNLSANKVNKTACIFCKQTLTIYDRYPLIEGTFFLSPVRHHASSIALTCTAGSPNSTSAYSPPCGNGISASHCRRDSSCKDPNVTMTMMNSAPLSTSSHSLASSSNSANSTPSTSPTTPSNAQLACLTSSVSATRPTTTNAQQQAPTTHVAQQQHQQPRQYMNSVCMSCLEGWTGLILCRFCGQRWDGSHLILGSIYMFDIFASETCCKARISCNTCFSPLKFALLQSQQNQRQQQLQQLQALTVNKNINNINFLNSCNTNHPNITPDNPSSSMLLGGNIRQRSRSYTAGRLASLQTQYSSLSNSIHSNPSNTNSKLLSSSATVNKLHVFNFFSHYSRRYKCDTCQSVDHHFVKPIETIFCIAK